MKKILFLFLSLFSFNFTYSSGLLEGEEDLACPNITFTAQPDARNCAKYNFSVSAGINAYTFDYYSVSYFGNQVINDFGYSFPSSLSYVYQTNYSGPVTITLGYHNSSGIPCHVVKTVEVNVDCIYMQCPEADFSYTVDSQDCGEYSFTSNANTAGVIEAYYFWQFGDGTTSTDENPVHNYSFGGTYTVTLTVGGIDREGNCCCDTYSAVINVCEGSGGCSLSDVSFSVNQSDCDTFAFTANATTGSNVQLNYTWDFGDGTTGTGATPTHTYSNNSLYTVTLTVSAYYGGTNFCWQSYTDDVVVSCLSDDCGVLVGEIRDLNYSCVEWVQFDLIDPQGDPYAPTINNVHLDAGWTVDHCEWTFVSTWNDVVTDTTAVPTIVINLAESVYCNDCFWEVTLTVIAVDENNNECALTITDDQFHGGRDIEEGCQGMQPRVYPNPVKDEFTVDFEDVKELVKEDVSIVITDLSGTTLRKYKWESNATKQTINASDLEKGIYLLQIVSNGEVIEVQKLLIE